MGNMVGTVENPNIHGKWDVIQVRGFRNNV